MTATPTTKSLLVKGEWKNTIQTIAADQAAQDYKDRYGKEQREMGVCKGCGYLHITDRMGCRLCVLRSDGTPTNYKADKEEVMMLKNDDEKLRWDLLPFEPIEVLVDILTYGSKKYKPNNWKKGTSFGDKERVFAAAMRHLVEYRKEKYTDAESGKQHLDLAFCNIMFLVYHSLVIPKGRKGVVNWE